MPDASSPTSETEPLHVKTKPASKQPVQKAAAAPVVTAVKAVPQPDVVPILNMFRAGKGKGGHPPRNLLLQPVNQTIEIATTDGWVQIVNVVFF